MKAVVFGSFVVDLMARTPHLPTPGETVKGSVFKLGPGGKGFNQGVAAHKSGGEIIMLTKLGRDSFGDVALNTMKELGMDTGRLLFSEEKETGSALIMVDEVSGQNKIVVVPGACETISREEVRSFEDLFDEAKFLLTQLETNMESIEAIIDLANEKGVKIILNTAPIGEIPDGLLRKTDLITPNEVEAETLCGIKVTDEESADRAAEYFFGQGVKTVIITLGAKGVYINDGKKKGIMPAFKVNAIDTTGAGDAFNGGLLTGLTEGMDLWEASRFACAVAAISVQRLGTALSMPRREEIDDFLSKH